MLLCSHPPFSLRMGDHFALMRDRLITESTLQVVIDSMNSIESACITDVDVEPPAKEEVELNCDEKLVLCRICHNEDLVRQMDAPCSCIGSLKYVHPRCVLRWCQEKGNTKCEICLKQYRGYIVHRKIVVHMRDSIIRTNNETQQRNAHRRIPTNNSGEQNCNRQAVYETLLFCFLLTLFVVLLRSFGVLVALLTVFLIAFVAPVLPGLHQHEEINDSRAGADSYV